MCKSVPPRFASGVVHFQKHVFPEKREMFEQLAHGQAPEALFITCSDSRIETAMITQTDPGDLFIIRNAGNIVPPHVANAGGTTAAIEFAVAALKVPHIVVCGHSNCGAMHGAMNPQDVAHLDHISNWLTHAKAAVEAMNTLCPHGDEDERMKILLQQNIILQLTHLKTHPSVVARLSEGSIKLHGWLYDIATGEIDAYDDKTGKFTAVSELYKV